MVAPPVTRLTCPKCHSEDCSRSHRSILERFASVFGYYPYRCKGCGERFLRFRFGLERHDPSATEKEIRATRASLRRRQQKQEIGLYVFGLLVFFALLAAFLLFRG